MNKLEFEIRDYYLWSNRHKLKNGRSIGYEIDSGLEVYVINYDEKCMTFFRNSLGEFEYIENAIQAAQEDWKKMNGEDAKTKMLADIDPDSL